MSDNVPVIDILILAAITIFLAFRLRAVLGRRTGDEREQPNPFDRPPLVPLQRGLADQPGPVGGRPTLVIDNDPTLPQSLDVRLSRVHEADPTFEERHFLTGAKAAFQMIVQAFAAGDLAALRPLLSSHLYGEFGRAISARPKRDAGGPVRFEGPIEAEIADARVVGREVQIQIRFASRQVGPGEEHVPEEESVDLWTFARDPRSRDPNWQLVETATGH